MTCLISTTGGASSSSSAASAGAAAAGGGAEARLPKLNPLLTVVEAALLEPKAAKAGREEGAVKLLAVESPKEKGLAAEVGFGFSVLAALKAETSELLAVSENAEAEVVEEVMGEPAEEEEVVSGKEAFTSLFGAASPLFFSVISLRCFS